MAIRTPFIVIGSKGTALPVKLLKLTEDLQLGANRIRWNSKRPTTLANQTVAWVARRGTPLQIHVRADALKNGVIKELYPVSWHKNGDAILRVLSLKPTGNRQMSNRNMSPSIVQFGDARGGSMVSAEWNEQRFSRAA
jgi:hypothetical protein